LWRDAIKAERNIDPAIRNSFERPGTVGITEILKAAGTKTMRKDVTARNMAVGDISEATKGNSV